MAPVRKSVLITGCSAGGIGGGLAEEFHEKGYHVFATARTPSKISQSLSESPNATILTLDVLSPESIAAAVESVGKETGGKLDVLVNNSGTAEFLPALDSPIGEAKELFELNFWAPLAMIQAFAPLLIKARGCLVNNSSVSGAVPCAFTSIYNASKAALLIGSETWRLELAPFGVRTLTLVTCAVKTNFFSNLDRKRIPETSYYSSVRDTLYDLSDGRMQADGISTKQYAVQVVRQVEKRTTGKYWVGGGAGGAKIGSWLLPAGMLERMLEKMYPVASKIKYDHKGQDT